MKFSLWTQYGARNSKPVFDAFAVSLRAAGHTVVENDLRADVNVIWSVLWKGRMAPNKDIFFSCKPVIVLEVGGIIRGETWKIGLNGIARKSLMLTTGHDSTRATQLGLQLKPWRSSGDHILICTQNPMSHNWVGQPCLSEWLLNTVEQIRLITDRKIIVRPHPRAPVIYRMPSTKNIEYQTPSKVLNTYDDFDLSFKDAHAVLSWTSNPGPQAIIEGVPAFVGDCSLAHPVGNRYLMDIENPKMPDRTQWLNDYAHTEYTLDEIRQGIPLKKIEKLLDK